MSFLQLNSVEKRYGSVRVIKGVDLAIEKGEFVVFVGPSGCGKSTLLRMIAGLTEIDSGTVQLDGRDITKLSSSKRDLAMVFQSYALYPHMSVFDNMSFALRLAHVDKAVIDEKVKRAADILNLTQYLQRTPKDLSGGQRQRVAIGRAVVREPKLFLFDEPLSNLDAALRVNTRLEIAQLHRRLSATMIYVTHDQVEAMTLADRIVVMKDGHIEQVGTPMEVFNHPLSTFVATFIGSPPMNLLPGTIVRETVRLADGTSVPVPERLRAFVKDGMAVHMGIRPDDISPVGHGLSQDGPGAEVKLTVDLAEPLGMESLIYTHLAGQEVQAKLYGPRIVAPGEVLTFRLALDRAHLFDAASGKSVKVL